VPTDPTEGWKKRHTLGRFVGDPLRRLHPDLDPAEIARRTLQAVQWVGLSAGQLELRARDLSSAEQWRAALARALVIGPQVLICDEPPRLDGSFDVARDGGASGPSGESWLDLLRELQRDRQRSLLLLTTDLVAVEALCQRAVVLYAGRIVEQAPISTLLRNPCHPYTRALLASDPGARLTPPTAENHPGSFPGCVYRGECSMAESSVCSARSPHLSRVASDHYAACHFVG
jgi:oligopeptide/dipeptide ABC transporter ATP-binding protein